MSIDDFGVERLEIEGPLHGIDVEVPLHTDQRFEMRKSIGNV